jgi:VIT1/CCC1 family predicted Fe2+/Mn2+ transporter
MPSAYYVVVVVVVLLLLLGFVYSRSKSIRPCL